MTVEALVGKLSLTVLTRGENREVLDGYACDLLSWAMGRLPADAAWLTVMGNRNVIAVASLKDAACVILAENAALDADAAEKAADEGMWLLQSPQDVFTLATRLAALLK